MGLRGALFDSGDTLIRPIGGRWNPRFDFEDVLFRHVPAAPAARLPQAFEAGNLALNASPSPLSRDDYHRAILRELGIENPSRDFLDELDAPLDGPPVEPFPEVERVLIALRDAGIRMAVVSDNWTTLEHLYEQLGLRAFFDAFIISAAVGYRKPDPRIYRAASDALRLSPDDCIFVDDDSTFAAAASRLGYHGYALCREPANGPGHGATIGSLDDVLEIFGIARQ